MRPRECIAYTSAAGSAGVSRYGQPLAFAELCKLSRIIGPATQEEEKKKPATPKRRGVNKFYYNAVKRRNGAKIGKLSDIA